MIILPIIANFTKDKDCTPEEESRGECSSSSSGHRTYRSGFYGGSGSSMGGGK